MNKPIRTLLVGLGNRGRKWARILDEEPLAETVGYVDIADAALEEVQSTYKVQPKICYKDMALAIKELEPDLVVLATPPDDRYREVLSIFESGCHLLSEKPLGVDFDEGLAMVHAAEEAKLAFAVGLNFRFQHSVLKAREILRSGEIGAARYAGYNYWRNRDGYAPRLNRFPLTMHQPMIYDQAIHHLDEIRFVYDAEVERLTCLCSNPPWSMYRDDASVTAILEMTGGLKIHYFGTWSGQTKYDQFMWRTDCDDGALFQYDLFSDLRIVRGKDSDKMEKISLPHQENLVDDARIMTTELLTQLLEGELHPEPTAIDHLKTFAVAAACEESDTSKLPIELSDFYDRHNVPVAWR